MRVLAIFAFSFSAAVFAAVYLLPEAVWLPAGGLLAALWLAARFLLPRNGGRIRRAALLACAGLAAGLLWTGVYSAVFFRPARALDKRTVRLTGVVSGYPQETDYGYAVSVLADTGSWVKLSAVVYGGEQFAALRPGDRVSTVARCTLGDRTFSGEEITYYTAKGIFLRAQAYGSLKTDRPDKIPLRWWAPALSQRLKESISAAFPPEEAALVRAVVTGNRDSLTDEYTASLERAGLAHTVAVSGMHLAYLAGLFSLFLGRGKRSTAAMVILWTVFFCGVAGSTPSVLRAAVMILLLQLAPLLDRERDDATALGTALLLLLLLNPFSAAHMGLQLSFASVAGILLISQGIQERALRLCGLDRHFKNRLVRWLVLIPNFFLSTLAATLGASVTTIPLAALHFGSFSLISPLSNLLTLWAVALVFLGGLGAGLLGLAAPAAAQAAAVPFAALARYLLWVVDRLGRVPLASLALDTWYYKAWVAFFCLLVGWCVCQKGPKRPVIPVCCALLTLTLALWMSASTVRPGQLEAAVLDVGQGQSVLLRLGRNLVLVDCGGDSRDDPGDVAADYIQALGGVRLDLLVISHFHADHANGVPELLKRVEVSEIALPDVQEGDELRHEILEMAEERGIKVRLISRDTTYTFEEGQTCRVCAPLGTGDETNELGLTVLASAGDFDALITGDMPGELEDDLLAHAKLPDIELLVVGHHGSKYSTTQELLDETKPELAVISAGAGNSYGHPARETLERLDSAGAEIWRTDLQGTVTVKSGGT